MNSLTNVSTSGKFHFACWCKCFVFPMSYYFLMVNILWFVLLCCSGALRWHKMCLHVDWDEMAVISMESKIFWNMIFLVCCAKFIKSKIWMLSEELKHELQEINRQMQNWKRKGSTECPTNSWNMNLKKPKENGKLKEIKGTSRVWAYY